MSRSSIFLGFIASFLVLCQWFVFQSFRKYWFQKREGVRRIVAYPVLIGFGLITIVAERLEFGSEIFPPGTFGRQLASVMVFSYIGWVVILSVVFVSVRAMDLLIRFKDLVLQPPISRAECCLWKQEQIGDLVSSRDEGGKRRKAVPEDNQLRSLSKSDSTKTMSIDYRHPTRRTFLKIATASGLTAAAGFGLEGIAEGYSQAVVEKHDVSYDLLDGATKPITIIHVTDCHFGMFFGPHQLSNLVDHLNSLEGDALCITGDVFHSAPTVVEQATPLLKKLRPRRLGSFAVLGNHDFYAGEIRSVESLKAAGLTLLRNQWVTLRVGSSNIHLGGLDDPWRIPRGQLYFPGFDALVRRMPAESGLRILLSHRPGILPQAAKQEIDLILAGHTHGGQIVVPLPGSKRGLSVAAMISEYTQGWYKRGASRMYLNRGVGFTFLPWRIHCPPEIALIRLNAGNSKVAKGC